MPWDKEPKGNEGVIRPISEDLLRKCSQKDGRQIPPLMSAVRKQLEQKGSEVGEEKEGIGDRQENEQKKEGEGEGEENEGGEEVKQDLVRLALECGESFNFRQIWVKVELER
uniref:Uncharacterized protein n=1 Tax=Chromera velia CCMP2878 TaxID=1169474 RepID=A0A0G4GGG2_9ALVE|mmetsp:Transcript_12160/g.23524  ORF Transcript_12160/g.23524 Transcript_12160/m.23524 type:complete len:112 (+) Transcript_12160:841-1176(+)|eukprot:Cvel_21786.t1-p1 / transcript=Cvel_21786.t1 / gene=Cvel_21786 / organism=Chromera_velia_CCMP2878 / gene_product=hypothetical protein / transcript_product=hypothetical protein / location=Cvel_scaffold2074:27830-28162(+) / protein_length=111 / sequence_SO=supercontig / SO=protein_coding / is_pseudo=false